MEGAQVAGQRASAGPIRVGRGGEGGHEIGIGREVPHEAGDLGIGPPAWCGLVPTAAVEGVEVLHVPLVRGLGLCMLGAGLLVGGEGLLVLGLILLRGVGGERRGGFLGEGGGRAEVDAVAAGSGKEGLAGGTVLRGAAEGLAVIVQGRLLGDVTEDLPLLAEVHLDPVGEAEVLVEGELRIGADVVVGGERFTDLRVGNHGPPVALAVVEQGIEHPRRAARVVGVRVGVGGHRQRASQAGLDAPPPVDHDRAPAASGEAHVLVGAGHEGEGQIAGIGGGAVLVTIGPLLFLAGPLDRLLGAGVGRGVEVEE